jgi:RND family efflux transporter MFP subunit
MLEQAMLDLERTEIRAPFDGRVRRENVDVGQFVSRGNSLAQLYSIDVAEVRLPLSSDDLAYVDLPLAYRDENGAVAAGPGVVLRADWAGKEYTWRGRIARTEGEIDEATRMLYAVAEVKDPYARGADPRRPPLAVGMFVRAEILGKSMAGAIVLPRSSVRGSDTVYVIDPDGRLRFRKVDIFKNERERVIVRSGLAEGERVCISPMEAAVDGMRVRVDSEEGRS